MAHSLACDGVRSARLRSPFREATTGRSGRFMFGAPLARRAGTRARKRTLHSRMNRNPYSSGDPSFEGRSPHPHAPEPDVVVSVRWLVVVAVRHAVVPGIVVPRTAAQRFGPVPLKPFSQKFSPGGFAAAEKQEKKKREKKKEQREINSPRTGTRRC